MHIHSICLHANQDCDNDFQLENSNHAIKYAGDIETHVFVTTQLKEQRGLQLCNTIQLDKHTRLVVITTIFLDFCRYYKAHNHNRKVLHDLL